MREYRKYQGYFLTPSRWGVFVPSEEFTARCPYTRIHPGKGRSCSTVHRENLKCYCSQEKLNLPILVRGQLKTRGGTETPTITTRCPGHQNFPAESPWSFPNQTFLVLLKSPLPLYVSETQPELHLNFNVFYSVNSSKS